MPDDIEQDGPITKKIQGLPKYNERQYMQFKYDLAFKAMLNNPTRENIEAFGKANCDLYEIEDAYRIGTRLILEYYKARLVIRSIYISYNETTHS